jgi:predicted ATP-dependent endonuclease of OLD family
MAIIARLVGEGIGPFGSFDFDFADAEGNPHPGPHIFAGVNGSGKTTILRTLAWMCETHAKSENFQWQDWQHLIEGHACSRAMVIFVVPGFGQHILARTMDTSDGWDERLHTWAQAKLIEKKIPYNNNLVAHDQNIWPTNAVLALLPNLFGRKPQGTLWMGSKGHNKDNALSRGNVLVIGYGPSRLLKHLPRVDISIRLKHARENALSFEATGQNNDAIQGWLSGLISKEALAERRGEDSSKYSTTLKSFEHALSRFLEQIVQFDLDTDSLQLKLKIYGKRLDLSQLPDGVRSTMGWLADFFMRMDFAHGVAHPERNTVLLLDEVDIFLHPKWQRIFLPSIRAALPEIQLFATSHSPFVIASCPGARIHVLKLDKKGHASNCPAEDAPVGESILATMKDIFGVDSRYDVETEQLMEEWNQLSRSQAAGKISPAEKDRLEVVTQALSSRSEELRRIVSPVTHLGDTLVASLRARAESVHPRPTKTKVRK